MLLHCAMDWSLNATTLKGQQSWFTLNHVTKNSNTVSCYTYYYYYYYYYY